MYLQAIERDRILQCEVALPLSERGRLFLSRDSSELALKRVRPLEDKDQQKASCLLIERGFMDFYSCHHTQQDLSVESNPL
jgi:hypothetical protein